MMKRNGILLVSGALALLFTLYITLDTFVISHVYAKVETSGSTPQESAGSANNSGVASAEKETGRSETTTQTTPQTTATSYSDDNIRIALNTYRENDTDIYVADIQLSSAEYLKTALAKASYGKNITDTTSTIAQENNAILAVNGDYYGVQETGYVIRNGVLYRNISKGNQEDLAIYEDGSMEIINEQDVTAEQLLENGVYNLLCFGPGLIEDGAISVSTADEVDKAMASNPRTAIGRIDDLHYVFVVADGRTSESAGLSLYELAQFMQKLGAVTAYNLDGGGSSTLYFNGEVINNPTSGSGKNPADREAVLPEVRKGA